MKNASVGTSSMSVRHRACCVICVVAAALTGIAGCGGFPHHESAQDLRYLPATTVEVNIRGLPDSAVSELARFDDLEFIDICGGWKVKPLRMTSAGFWRLADLRLPMLRTVRFCHSPEVDDECLRALGSIPNIERVTLEWCTGFGQSGLEELLRSRLKDLDLTGCDQVDDSWIGVLTHDSTLTHLGLSGTSLSPSGVDRIRAALPGCRIDTERLNWDRP